MPRNVLRKFGLLLSNRKNFLIYSTLGFGLSFYVFEFVWLRIEHGFGGAIFWLFMLPLSLAAGFGWGFLMWPIVQRQREKIRAQLAKRNDA